MLETPARHPSLLAKGRKQLRWCGGREKDVDAGGGGGAGRGEADGEEQWELGMRGRMRQ